MKFKLSIRHVQHASALILGAASVALAVNEQFEAAALAGIGALVAALLFM